MKKKLHLNTSLLFLPLLVFYLIIVVAFSTDDLVADEGRYIKYATNLTEGFYADSNNPSLRNGPGYPLLLSPFVLMKAPYLIIKLLNPLFIFLAVMLFYKTLTKFLQHRTSLIVAYILGLYPAFIKWSTFMHSETFAIFLVCAFLYHFIKLNTLNSKTKYTRILAAFFLGVLSLTKVIFGYVILAIFILFLLYYFITKTSKVKQNLAVLAIAFSFCIPFLYYTYNLTGKVFHWGTNSGEILYWRSTPFEQEYGDWISSSIVLGKSKGSYFNTEAIVKNHGSFIQSIEPLSHIERDNKYKEKAIENIKQNPVKYLQNTLASATRLFFNYPYTYTPQKISTYFYIIPNMFLVVSLLLAISLALKNRRKLRFEFVFLAFLSFIFIGGLTLSDGRVRHLLPIIPVLLLIISYSLSQFFEFKELKK